MAKTTLVKPNMVKQKSAYSGLDKPNFSKTKLDNLMLNLTNLKTDWAQPEQTQSIET